MTQINKMIKEAKSWPRPKELLLPRNRVRQVAEHARLIGFYPDNIDIDTLEKMIVNGEMKMLDIPVRVVGLLPKDK